MSYVKFYQHFRLSKYLIIEVKWIFFTIFDNLIFIIFIIFYIIKKIKNILYNIILIKRS